MSKFDHLFWTAADRNWILWYYTRKSARESVGPATDTNKASFRFVEVLVDGNWVFCYEEISLCNEAIWWVRYRSRL